MLFGRLAGERTKETGTALRTLHREADRFDAHGMASLFANFREPKQQDRRMPPPPLRQLIVDRKTEYPAFTPHELATLCYVASGRRPSSHTVKRILATGPKLTSISRRYPRYHQFTDPAERRLAIIRLHAEGWTVSSIASYLHTSRPTVQSSLRRWVEEGVRRLENKSHDKLGYVRFRHWRIYGEHGLARQRAAVWLYGETLLLEISDEPLAQYSVAHAPDHRHLRDIVPRQLFETQYRSPQLPLRELGDGEWLTVVRVPSATPRRQRKDAPHQQLLLTDLSRA